MLLFSGLGNPGDKYAKTKHNAGFWILDKLAEKKGKPFKPGNGQYVFMEDNKNEIIFMKPTTGMNKSGLALKQVVKQYGLKTSDICIIVDDVDLPLGKLRIKPKGGDGGHRGLENIIYHLKSIEFPRIRFGIGTSENMRPAESYVLKPFSKKEVPLVNESVNRAVDAVENIYLNGLSFTMNYINKG